jgi:C-methyltransferase C-terminal domain/Methyltransferase domain/Putative zinc binding domain
MNCQACNNTDLIHILSLGPLPPCNDMRPIGQPAKAQEWMPTDLLYCPKCELVQLEYVGDPKVVFPAAYPYTSGSTKLLRDNFKDLAREAKQLFDLQREDLVVDIGSNDGTLLTSFGQGQNILGVEPTDIADITIGKGIKTFKEFFNRDAALKIRDTLPVPARLITCANCFAHMQDIHGVIEGVLELLHPNGVFVTESTYLIDTIDKLQYDTIYHEHLRYYSLTSLTNLLESHGLHVFRATRIPTHGGSIRVYAHRIKPPDIIGSSAIDKILYNEPIGERMLGKLEGFANEVKLSKLKLMSDLYDIKLLGKHVTGIGAPSRASTVINYCRLDASLVEEVLEIDGSLKLGKYMPGTNIPVLGESFLFAEPQPEYAILFSWHIADELIPKLKAQGYRGQFIMPCQRVRYTPNIHIHQMST